MIEWTSPPPHPAGHVIGVDLGGTNVRAAVLNRNGEIQGEGRQPSRAQEGLPATVAQIAAAIRQAVSASGVDQKDIAGIGLGVPGQHISASGVVRWAPNFKDWNDIQLLQPIFEVVNLPLMMGNDANVAALGEFRFGAGREVRSMIMMTLGTGIGGGIILNGKLWLGANEGGGEIGHMIVLPDGPRCGCGSHGCIESLGGRDAIVDRCVRKLQQGRPSTLTQKVAGDLRDITPAFIAEAADGGDQIALETMHEVGYYIGLAVQNIINVLNPEMVVIGGGVAQAGELLFGPIRRTAQASAIRASYAACQIVPATLGDDAGVMGGATLVLDALELHS